ncbi:hypothetical protein [Halobacterium wangiae]|uniref:hypothetical protein n=1 Tax=Halobacterium wangiae TaxID=2902623 RepID=UPI001E2FCCA9|nr:hypothetical protein [Halobacterium wangiae]
MVEKRETDGKRIAGLLSSEVTGHENEPYGRLAVTNADPGVEATADGAHAYDVELDGERLAEVFVQPDRARVELRGGLTAARETAAEGGLRARPVGGEPPRLVVFVESGAEVKRALDVLGAAATS